VMDALTIAIIEQFSQQMVAQLDAQAVHYEEHFRSLKRYRMVTFESKVITERALQNVGSPARIMLLSSFNHLQITHKITTYYISLSVNKII
jgi:hypothetical protein